MTIKKSQIRTQSVPRCGICGTVGEPLYQRLRDRLFGVPGEWDLKKCSNPDCGLLWLDPRPIEEDIGKAYHTYYAHQDASVPATTLLRCFYRQVKAGYNWRGLEPPRQLHLFNSKSLTNLALVAKIHNVSCSSSVRAWKIFLESRICFRDGKVDRQKGFSVTMRIWAELMEVVDSIIKVFFRNAGEELKLLGKKNA